MPEVTIAEVQGLFGNDQLVAGLDPGREVAPRRRFALRDARRAARFGDGFTRIADSHEIHRTPFATEQSFTTLLLRRSTD